MSILSYICVEKQAYQQYEQLGKYANKCLYSLLTLKVFVGHTTFLHNSNVVLHVYISSICF